MAEITAAMVKSLREKTGLPMMDCKKALEKTNGDQEKAVDELRKEGIKTKETRLGRETSAGRRGSSIAPNAMIGNESTPIIARLAIHEL